MEKTITITTNDFQRLIARLLPQNETSNKIITMNSRVKLEDLKNKIEAEITITSPQDAEPRERRVSVFSEIGLALLGRCEDDIVSWRIRNSVGVFKVKKVTYDVQEQ